MSCTPQFLSAALAIALAGISIVASRWGVDYVKKVNAESGGVRATYARHVPYWAGPTLAASSTVAAVVTTKTWYTSCTSGISLSPASLALIALSGTVFVVAMIRLIMGKKRTDRRFPAISKNEDPSETVRTDHSERWRARGLVVSEYGVSVAVAVALLAGALFVF